jgi:hypothetical protein
VQEKAINRQACAMQFDTQSEIRGAARMKVFIFLMGVSSGESLSGNADAGLVFMVLGLLAFAISERGKA